MFSGNFQHVIDSKGRVSVPASFRDLVQVTGDATVFITRHPLSTPRCLEAYPQAAWKEISHKLLNLNRFDQNVMRLEHLFVGSAHRCDIDAQGRILIPATLRESAALGKEVVFVGAADRFRIFDRAAWEEALEDAAATFKANPELLARMNL